MAERTSFFRTLRFRTSLACTALLNLGVADVTGFRGVCSPGFNCHGCPWATAACPVGVLAYGSALRTLPALALGTVLAVGAAVGRLACAFVCPFGLLQELLYRIPTKKLRLPGYVRYGKYLALGLLVFAFPLVLGFERSGYLALTPTLIDRRQADRALVTVTVTNLGERAVESPEIAVVYVDRGTKTEVWRREFAFPDVSVAPGESVTLEPVAVPDLTGQSELTVESPQSAARVEPRYKLYFCKICPNGTLTASLPALAAGVRSGIYGWDGFVYVRLAVLVAFLALTVVASRAFCRSFCPLGAVYALASRFAIWRVAVDRDACVECGVCNEVCPVEIDVSTEAGGPECIACGECIEACPHSAVKRRLGL